MVARIRARGRVVAAAIAVLLLVSQVPSTALADDDGIWTRWARRVTDRELPAEVPIAIIASLPAMILITPIWLVQEALEAGDDEES